MRIGHISTLNFVRNCIANLVDCENNNEEQNPFPLFMKSSRAQEPAIKKVFHKINHCDATTPASMIATELHFISGSINPNWVTAEERKANDKGKHPKQTNNTVNIIVMSKKNKK